MNKKNRNDGKASGEEPKEKEEYLWEIANTEDVIQVSQTKSRKVAEELRYFQQRLLELHSFLTNDDLDRGSVKSFNEEVSILIHDILSEVVHPLVELSTLLTSIYTSTFPGEILGSCSRGNQRFKNKRNKTKIQKGA